jgi:hypothetical protein
VARAVLLSVLFAVLLPTITHASDGFGGAGFRGLTDICSVDGPRPTPDGPASPEGHTHKPCLFCISSVPLFTDALAPTVVAIVDGAPLSLGRLPTTDMPPDRAGTRPVSPRAPPGRA